MRATLRSNLSGSFSPKQALGDPRGPARPYFTTDDRPTARSFFVVYSKPDLDTRTSADPGFRASPTARIILLRSACGRGDEVHAPCLTDRHAKLVFECPHQRDGTADPRSNQPK